jgi:hypothetical protein
MTARTAYEHDAPMELHVVEAGVGCGDCGDELEPGTLTLCTPDAAYFYCFECITRVYEAMKAARGA